MDDDFRALGFERWTSQLPLQTTMYVHAHAARDGARLYLAVPAATAAPTPADSWQQLAETVEAFFQRHGGRESLPVIERLNALLI